MTYCSEVAPLRRVVLEHARDAFVGPARIAEQWRALGYAAPPDFDAACRESDAFARLLESFGVRVEWMQAEDLGLDSIYVRDAAVMVPDGALIATMGKTARAAEPGALERALRALGVPIAGSTGGGARLEGGDAVWLRPDLLAVGRGYRTDARGVERLRRVVGPEVEVVEVPLPHWRGPEHVFHLMSVLSPVADDLLLVHSPLLPVPFRELLLERGFGLVDVPGHELDALGCNVLAVAPRVVVAVEGAPDTRRRLAAAGVDVHTFRGGELCLKGAGGPTCLARTLEREG